ncbi:hypothetical protein ACE6H2_014003 [Prunus campanulata]
MAIDTLIITRYLLNYSVRHAQYTICFSFLDSIHDDEDAYCLLISLLFFFLGLGFI